jgi:hypothetical protein
MTASARIIRRCLADLGIDISSDTSKEQDDNDQKSEVLYAKALLKECDSLDDEFALVKKIYFARILEQHPDKVSLHETVVVDMATAITTTTSNFCLLCRTLCTCCHFFLLL